jgi:hypothetical protein
MDGVRLLKKHDGTFQLTPTFLTDMKVTIEPLRQRSFSRSHAEKLATIMEKGDFLEGDIKVALMPAGERWLANGQHQYAAVCITGTPVPCTYREYACDGMAAYRRLFFACDTEQRARGLRDCARAFMMGDESNTDPGIINLFRSGYETMQKARGMPASVIHKAIKFDRFEGLRELKPELEVVKNLIEQCSTDQKSLINRACVIGPIIETAGIHSHFAAAFWEKVITGAGLAKHDPALTLRDHLARVRIRTGGTGQEQMEIYARCINAWNAECRGRHLQKLTGRVRKRMPVADRPYAHLAFPRSAEGSMTG